MYKALIVDDDKLVRKGLISIMPWDSYGIEVAGDVNSGEKALEFLKDNEVDILITDVVMPVMTGLELTGIVRSRYPGIYVVVLSFYREFAYVQEALRLGAIDYIIKTQLEKEQMSDVLARIVGRIKTEEKYRLPGGRHEAAKCDGGGECRKGYAVISVKPGFSADTLKHFPGASGCGIFELEKNLWFVKYNPGIPGEIEDELIQTVKAAGGILIEVSGIEGRDVNSLHAKLKDYAEQVLFYEYTPDITVYRLEIHDSGMKKPQLSFELIQELISEWSSFQWIHDDAMCKRQLEKIEKLRSPVSGIESIFCSAMALLKKNLSFIDELHTFSPAGGLMFWSQWLHWIEDTRLYIQEKTLKPFYSKEVVQSIMKALDRINLGEDEDIRQESLAREVNLSRGYFSQCFKDIVGKPFNEYLKGVKIERAKQMLLMTDKQIYLIAEKLGYKSEKYFSRVFRESCNMVPSEYRESNMKKKNVDKLYQ